MHHITRRIYGPVQKRQTFGIHSSVARAAITRFNLPAMSPTMTEGVIQKWMIKEGESFSAGDVLIELTTDKAQIDVEAQDDGVLAKIILPEGEKAAVNTLIGLLAEEGDDISNVQIPKSEEKKQEAAATPSTKETPQAPSEPIHHGAIDTTQLKKPLSPAVLSLVLKHHIQDVTAIKASGPGGRILKGDVLAHLGKIPFKPAPKFNNSAAPPRDQIVFAKTTEAAPAKKKEVVPNHVSKQVVIDDLLVLRRKLNEQHNTHVSVDELVEKAAARALYDVTNKVVSPTGRSVIAVSPSVSSPRDNYKGGEFRVLHLAPPVYDFIYDREETAKPYVLHVSPSQRIDIEKSQQKKDTLLDVIEYLGEVRKPTPRTVHWKAGAMPLDITQQPAKYTYKVELKLQANDKTGAILKDKKVAAFMDRVEYYIHHPTELVQ
ncbi:hypothetical protein BDF14DRAFT_1809329 [Spinellus fusiger]|nr:hypothetical protein BDF14DRAFT_1809329 [Spinellus fusiger]